jgi:hypothetical protein
VALIITQNLHNKHPPRNRFISKASTECNHPPLLSFSPHNAIISFGYEISFFIATFHADDAVFFCDMTNVKATIGREGKEAAAPWNDVMQQSILKFQPLA